MVGLRAVRAIVRQGAACISCWCVLRDNDRGASGSAGSARRSSPWRASSESQSPTSVDISQAINCQGIMVVDPKSRPPTWSDHKARHPRWFVRSILAVEWATEWLVYTLKRWAFVELLSIAGSFALLATLFGYCRGADDRVRAQQDARKARQFQAWQVINSAQGKPGNGGRTQALEDLAADSVDLSGVDLSGSWLEGLTLPSVRFVGLKADSANLRFADLRGADLKYADFYGADLSYADLRGADLFGARLSTARLDSACLDGANLTMAVVDSAILNHVSMRNTIAFAASFKRSYFLEMAPMDSAYFRDADFDSATLSHAPMSSILYGAQFVGTSFLYGAPIQIERELRGAGARFEHEWTVPGTIRRPRSPSWSRPETNLTTIYPRRSRMDRHSVC